ncbi:MAG: shikimate kinase [Aquificaceae bacterium]
MRYKRVFLVGFMGSGKTTVGEYLSQKLGWDFYDVDRMVEGYEGMTIEEIFDKKGEEYFRRREVEVLREVVKKEEVVVSTGGGLGANEEAIKFMKEMGLVVWLSIPFEEFLRRCKSKEERPLLRKPLEKLKDLYNRRSMIYSQAHMYVDATRDPDYVSHEIINGLKF